LPGGLLRANREEKTLSIPDCLRPPHGSPGHASDELRHMRAEPWLLAEQRRLRLEARGVHEALEADGGALLAEVKGVYADDFALWERARRREAVSEAHESLAASLERYREKVPWVRTKAPPSCESGQSGGCSCSACCWARGSKEEAAAGPGPPSRRCAVCGVEKEACGGLPPGRRV